MKFKTTKKAILNGYPNTISIGYCSAWNLLRYEEPVAYTCGTYGWNADIYQITPIIAIVTGYRPFGNIKAAYSNIREYEAKAKEINENYNLSYNDKKVAVTNLLDEFITELLNQ